MLLDLARPAIATELHDVSVAVQRLLDTLVVAPHGSAKDIFDAAAWPYQRPKWLREAVLGAAALGQADREELAEAYRHDAGFPGAYDDDTFAFRFPALSPAAYAAGSALLKDLYEKVFAPRRGFVSGGTTRAQRNDFEQSFRELNPDIQVCPACTLAPLSQPAGSRTLVDLDHVLPRSRYPQLTVHADNLVPLCKPCNALKWDRDPLDDGGSRLPLTASYLPYLRAAIGEIAIDVAITRPGRSTLSLRGQTRAAARRVETLERLLEVSDRWSGWLPVCHAALTRVLYRQPGPGADRDEVRTRLLDIAEDARVLSTMVAGKLVEAAWARWLAEHALDAVMDELGRPG